MAPQLFLDIHAEQGGGSLFRIQQQEGASSFLYDHSTYDPDTGDIKVYKTPFPSFEAFWQELTKDREWHYKHPLYVHPEIREFIGEELKHVNWEIYPDRKWQESHQRQWKKVLSDPANYYGSS